MSYNTVSPCHSNMNSRDFTRSIYKSLEKIYILISKDQFNFLKCVLEGYDSVACLSSVDMDRGLVCIYYPHELQIDLIQLLSVLAPAIKPTKSTHSG